MIVYCKYIYYFLLAKILKKFYQEFYFVKHEFEFWDAIFNASNGHWMDFCDNTVFGACELFYTVIYTQIGDDLFDGKIYISFLFRIICILQSLRLNVPDSIFFFFLLNRATKMHSNVKENIFLEFDRCEM